MHEHTALAIELPPPATVQQELGRVLRQASVLRRLLKLSMAEQERRAKDEAAMKRESEVTA